MTNPTHRQKTLDNVSIPKTDKGEQSPSLSLHLSFYSELSPTGKTEIIKIYSLYDRSFLGIIKWEGRWRQYVYHPVEDIIWSWDCLEELSKFIYNLNIRHKKHD